jgi:hypothetical protein
MKVQVDAMGEATPLGRVPVRMERRSVASIATEVVPVRVEV